MKPRRPGIAGRSSGGPHPGREAGGDLHLELVPRREAPDLVRMADRLGVSAGVDGVPWESPAAAAVTAVAGSR